jgi:hypothetical protein
MDCKIHPAVPSVERCSGCAEPFCGDCLVEVHGQKYCASCKVMALKNPPLHFEEPTIPCKEANEALTWSIVGLFCFGIIVEPIALNKALKARKLINENPRLQGSGKVIAAIVISSIGLLLWIIGMLVRAGGGNRRDL